MGDTALVTESTYLSDENYYEMADLYSEALSEYLEELQNNGSGIKSKYNVRIPPCRLIRRYLGIISNYCQSSTHRAWTL